VTLLLAGVREPEASKKPGEPRSPVHWRTLKLFDKAYWWVVAVGAVFTLARFSEAFLILRARQNGLSDALAPTVLVLMNAVYASTAYPAGKLADRIDRRLLLAAGLLVLLLADLALARAEGLTLVAVGIALWGLHMGLTQGLLATMVAAAAPSHLRGSAFGFLNLAGGCAMLAASMLAGLLWERLGAPSTFYAGAAFSAAALVLLAAKPADTVPIESATR
jgi:MFS family permease